MALKTFNPTTPGQRQLVIVDRSGLYKGKPVKGLTEGLSSKGGAQQCRPHDGSSSRWWPQAHLPHGRLPSSQVRHVGDRRAYRIRSEPDRIHCVDQV